MQIRLNLEWALSHSGHPRLDGGHSATPGRASDIHPLSGCEKDNPTQWAAVVDYDSLRDGRSMSRHSESEHASMPSECGRRASLTDSVVPEASPFAAMALQIDDTSALHPFYPHKSDAGPVRLMTIAHAFNYRMAVLRDGVKSAVRVGRSRKAEGFGLVVGV